MNNFLRKIKKWILVTPIFVFSVGKVGSSSIVVSLQNYNLNVVQPHSLRTIKKGGYFLKLSPSGKEKLFNSLNSFLLRAKTFFFFIYKRKKKIKIISLFREPIGRNISSFFERYEDVLDSDIKDYRTEELIDLFWRYTNHNAPLVWFDDEFRKALGINIIDYPFNKELGYTIISKDNVDILLIKMEYLDQLNSVIGNFINVKNFKLINVNLTKEKVDNEVYSNFKKQLVISDEYIEKCYNSEIMEHFYSPKEIEEFKSRWM